MMKKMKVGLCDLYAVCGPTINSRTKEQIVMGPGMPAEYNCLIYACPCPRAKARQDVTAATTHATRGFVLSEPSFMRQYGLCSDRLRTRRSTKVV
jgi:hypothetical protein